jgi:Putative DNA-binding domain
LISIHWVPKTCDELEGALLSQSVSESTYLDFKSPLLASNGESLGLAKLMAAMSVLGGTIVLGVDEEKPKADGGPSVFRARPFILSGLRERVSQKAINRVDPPVFVETGELTRPDNTGYLVVIIPASSSAPHMVDGRYYARTDSTNRQLNDEEVRYQHLRNTRRQESYAHLLSEEIAREPSSLKDRTGARLFAIAQPVSHDKKLIQRAVYPDGLHDWVNALRVGVLAPATTPYSPCLTNCQSVHLRSSGASLSSYYISPSRSIRIEDGCSEGKTKDLVDLEVNEDGGLRLFYGRASLPVPNSNETAIESLFANAIAGEVSTLIQISREVSKAANFFGSWYLGVAIVNIKGMSV